MHRLNISTSLVVKCDTQEDIDYYWEKLGANGDYMACGWLTDRYGVSWQIVPAILRELMRNKLKQERVMNAFMKMQKFNIKALLEA